jgi:very-short-patch-repair endonuclease
MDRSIAELANRQRGVVARRQLVALGLGDTAIERMLVSGRLHRVHQGVFAVGHKHLNRHGRWLAAVLAYGSGALLSHRSAAALWGIRADRPSIDVTAQRGRHGRRAGIVLHRAKIDDEDRDVRAGIPLTSPARTLFDLSEVVKLPEVQRACEEADRLGLLEMKRLERVIERGWGRHALRPMRPIVAEARMPASTRSPLEDEFARFCHEHELSPPVFNATVLDYEIDALWPARQLIVELDGFAYHHHRAAFERDRARDAALQIAGYRILRITHRRLNKEPSLVAHELRTLLT